MTVYDVKHRFSVHGAISIPKHFSDVSKEDLENYFDENFDGEDHEFVEIMECYPVHDAVNAAVKITEKDVAKIRKNGYVEVLFLEESDLEADNQ